MKIDKGRTTTTGDSFLGLRIQLKKNKLKRERTRKSNGTVYYFMNGEHEKAKYSKRYKHKYSGYYEPSKRNNINVAEPLKLFNLKYKMESRQMTNYINNLIEHNLKYEMKEYEYGIAVICIPCMRASKKVEPVFSYFIDNVLDEYKTLLKDMEGTK